MEYLWIMASKSFRGHNYTVKYPKTHLSVGAHIQSNWQALARFHPSTGSVEGQLSYWDTHTICT